MFPGVSIFFGVAVEIRSDRGLGDSIFVLAGMGEARVDRGKTALIFPLAVFFAHPRYSRERLWHRRRYKAGLRHWWAFAACGTIRQA
jgi:hypothetical protein